MDDAVRTDYIICIILHITALCCNPPKALNELTIMPMLRM